MAVLACFSIKGGVGKTTTAVTLSHIAAQLGMRTLVWDLDPQGAASFYLRATPGEKFAKSMDKNIKRLSRYIVPTAYKRLEVIPTRFSNRRLEDLLSQGSGSDKRLKKILFPLQLQYDLIVLDCPPGVSNVAANALHASDVVLVPTIPTPLSVRTLRQLRRYVRELDCKATVWPFFTMFDGRRSTHKNIRDYYLGVHTEDMLQSVVPYSAQVERMGVAKRPLTDYAWSSPPSVAYRNLFEELQSEFRRLEQGR